MTPAKNNRSSSEINKKKTKISCFSAIMLILTFLGAIGGFILCKNFMAGKMAEYFLQKGYLFHGLKKEIIKSDDTSMIFQDFSLYRDDVGLLWADANAEYHDGKGQSYIKAHTAKDAFPNPTYLVIEFDRQGFGCNIMIRPKDNIPLAVENFSALVFDMRSTDEVCLGVRVMEGDGEIWEYSTAPGAYFLHCNEQPYGVWQPKKVFLKDDKKWVKFRYDGNMVLGNNTHDNDIVALVYFEVGRSSTSKDPRYLGSGQGIVDIRNIRLEK